MAFPLLAGSRIWETSTTATTGGDVNLGGAEPGFGRFRDEYADGEGVILCLFDQTGGSYEVSLGTLVYGTPDKITSRTVRRSRLSGGHVQIGVPIAWGAGTRNAICSAAGPDHLFSFNNLTDLPDPAAARTALGLTSAATTSIGSSAGQLIAWASGPKYPAGDGANITNVHGIITGTKAPFAQAVAPTGWVKDTSNDDKALRVVSGGTGGSSGGSRALSAATVGGHVLTVAELATHTHAMYRFNGVLLQANPAGTAKSVLIDGASPGSSDGSENTASNGSSNAHDHALALAYVDIIICSRI